MYVFYCGSITSNRMRSGCSPAPLLWSPQASEDPFNRNRKQFIARVMTPLIQPHESSPPRRNTGKFRSHQQGVEGYSRGGGGEGDLSLSLLMHICMYVCVSQKEGGAHLSSSSRVTLLHTRPGEAHLNATTAASNARLHPQERTTVWTAIQQILKAYRSLWSSDQRLWAITQSKT